MLTSLLPEADRIGKYRQGIRLGEIGHGIEAAFCQQLVNLQFRCRREAIANLFHHRGRQYLAEHGAGAGMGRRIRL